jgi:cold shock CspA family protein
VELKVTGPGGFKYIFTEDDLVTSEELGQYFMVNFPNSLSNGTYTFSLTDSAGRTVNATRDFTLSSVPRVDYTTMLPLDNTYVNSTTPTLSWGSVGSGYYYRVMIWDWNADQRPVFMSKYIQNTSITIPSGYLFPNTPYNWRVDVYDASLNNRPRSNNLRFSTGSSSATSSIQWVNFYNENNYYVGAYTSISTNVLGILPNQVTSFNVSGPGLNYNFQQTDIKYNLAWQQGSMYTFGQLGTLPGGSYTFSLQTPHGNASFPRSLAPATIAIVDQATMSPTNNTYLTNLTPTLTWGAVTGSPRYYRVLVMDWRYWYVIYVSTRSTNLSATIPAGVLKAGKSYMWRVEVYDDASGNGSSRSTSGWNCFTTPREWMIDFGADGRTNIAVYHSASGLWFIKPSSGAPDYYVGYGGTGYVPVPGNYDGDGKTDIAVYHSTSGLWFIKPSSGAADYYVGYGGTGYDPVLGDYDGDGKTDIGVYHSASGLWFIKKSSDGVSYSVGYGGTGYVPVPGDYDGDGKTDVAVYHSASGLWFIKPSSGAADYYVGYGGSGYVPVPGDYDGDGKTDIAVYHSASGLWFIKPSLGGADYYVGYGGTGYTPVNLDYLHGYVY